MNYLHTNIMEQSSNLTGHFLIAMPGLNDPNFHQSVTYICEHSKDGAVGIIINHPLNIPLKNAFDQMGIDCKNSQSATMPLYFGGPVQTNRGFVVHRHRQEWRSTLTTSGEIAVTTSQDILQAIALGQGPKDALVALGYAGWDKNELEQEIADNVWISCEANPSILFNTPHEQRWSASASLIGVNMHKLSLEVGHA